MRQVGAKIGAMDPCGNQRGVSEHRLTRRVAPGNRCRGLLWWIAPVELRGGAENGKGGNRHKKRPRKNRGHTMELNFRAGVSAVTHIGWAKRSSFFHRCRARNFAYRVSGSRDGLYGKLQTLLSSSGLFRPPDSGSLFRPQAAAPVSSPGSDLLIRSPPGPGIIRRAAPARARRHQRHRLPESRPAAWRRVPRTRSRAPAAPRRPS